MLCYIGVFPTLYHKRFKTMSCLRFVIANAATRGQQTSMPLIRDAGAVLLGRQDVRVCDSMPYVGSAVFEMNQV